MLELLNPGTLLGFLAFHVVMAFVLTRLASRFGVRPSWFALVPFLNIVLFLRVAGRPDWWVVLFLVPGVNLVTLVVATMSLCSRHKISAWWGLLAPFSPLNLALYLYLAYGTDAPPAPAAAPN